MFYYELLMQQSVPAGCMMSYRQELLTHTQAQPGDWLLQPGRVTDKGAAELSEELVREKLYMRYWVST